MTPDLIYIKRGNSYTDYYKLRDYFQKKGIVFTGFNNILREFLEKDTNYICIYNAHNHIAITTVFNVISIKEPPSYIKYTCVDAFIAADIIESYMFEKLL